ncbi:MAG: DUF1553 domain-containing protein, partial [Bacteroidetes bacterium]
MKKLRLRTSRWAALAVPLLALALWWGWPQAGQDPLLPDKVDFNYHIRPILSQNCYVCHGPDSSTREAELRLDQYESATALREEGGAAIVPGKPGSSLLMERITATDPDHIMPPPEAKKTLTAREIALLEKWIEQGAKWKPHWAFINPQKAQLPRRLRNAPLHEVIDYFVEEQLRTHELQPGPPADNNSLIRRVSYLLTGLPPSPEELAAFLADSSELAYERMLDHYLASPHFGERWARHWMDLVRYGESMGHEGDFNISSPWQYRDYLIRAFNEDVPYDQLVKEHLAGDLLHPPRYHPTQGFNESIIGTGYFFLGEGKHSPVNLKLEEADKIDNMIDVTSKTFQALTVSCARCHDHKFDPIPTSDYYAMYGMIESARLGPLPARQSRKQDSIQRQLLGLQHSIRQELGQQWRRQLAAELSRAEVYQLAQFVKKQPATPAAGADTSRFRIIGDFRAGSWKGWYATGRAFGRGPLMGEPLIDAASGTIREFRSGMASSRAIGPGIQGVLRSPNFLIRHDTIAVRARGKNGLIRVIVDNFQVIQGPLYDTFERLVDEEEWQTYYLDVSLAKGHKAYLQFTPGHYGQQRQHTYRITPADYIEVQYALSFEGGLPDMQSLHPRPLPPAPATEKLQAMDDWMAGRATEAQMAFLGQWLRKRKKLLHAPELRPLLARYDSLAAQMYDSTHFIGMVEGDAVFSPVFIRGSVDNPSKERVPHRFLSAIHAGPQPFPQQGSGRLAWAQAVVDPANPLTARVMVNRIWHHLFGRGIVETVDNFGLQGKLPTHPALLDELAVRFVEEGWSVKTMIRHILRTRAFRRATSSLAHKQEKDPHNLYLHHFPLRRLEAEAIRDGMLAVSGRLNPKMYGPSVPVYLSAFMTGRGRPRTSGPMDGKGRRSIYIALRRNFIPPMMLTFDMPIPFSTFGRRNTTNVPAQSLMLMNDPLVQELALSWAT